MTALLAIWKFAKSIPWQAWAALALFAAFFAWGEVQHNRGYDQREAEYEADRLAEEAQARKDDAKAAKRREENRIVNDRNDNARQEVINNAQDDTTDAAGRALACERLRQAGIDTPAACG